MKHAAADFTICRDKPPRSARNPLNALDTHVECKCGTALGLLHQWGQVLADSFAARPFAVSLYFWVGERGESGCVISTKPMRNAGER